MSDQYNKLHSATGSTNEARKDWKVICKKCQNRMGYLQSAVGYTGGEPSRWVCGKCGEETSDVDHPQIEEMTTSADIASVPQMGFREPTPKELDVIGFPKYRKNKPVKEAQEPKDLKKQVIGQFEALVKQSKLHPREFTSAFPRFNDATPATVLLRFTHLTEDLNRLYNKLPNDQGELELIKNAVKDRRPINGFEFARGYNNIYGCRLAAQADGTRMVYEAGLNIAYRDSETLLVNDIDIVGEVVDQIKSVKAADRILFPIGGLFEPRVFNQISTIISTGVEPEEEIKIGGNK